VPEDDDGPSRRIEPVRGTQDLLPVDAARWSGAETEIRHILANYGFGEIRTPIFEHAELYRRPLGLGSDVVAKEMYEFADKGGRSLALRPEGTAGVIRAYISHGLYAKGARHKLFYVGPIFRYDRPQAGRFRQHHQVGVEVLGDPSAASDAEIVELGSAILESIGVSGYERRVNSGGCPACRPEFEKSLRDFAGARKTRLCRDCAGHRLEHNVLRILDCKVDACRAVMAEAPFITDFLCGECSGHFKALLGHLDSLGVAYSADRRLVRGFDYYTRTVYEFIHPVAGQVLGGGRYDGLVELLGGPSTPGTGWGMGLERVLGLSTKAFPSTGVRAYVTAVNAEFFRRSIRLCRDLRRAGISCEVGMEGRSLNSQMRTAGSSMASFAVIVGSGEKVGIKNLSTGNQEDVAESEVPRRLKDPK